MQRPKRFKIARRLGPSVFDQTQTERFALAEARKKGPMGKDKHRRNISAFNTALREKQRVRLYYGLTERQFASYVKESTEKKGNPVEHLYARLESRLDNVAYRLGLAPTHRAARQMVSHGHLTVDDSRTRVPSRQVHVGETIGIRGGSQVKKLFTETEEKRKEQTIPTWMSYDEKKNGWRMDAAPKMEDVSAAGFDLRSVIEFYSR